MEFRQQIVEDAKRDVLPSWSVQDAISRIAVAGGEGCCVLDRAAGPAGSV